MLILTRRPQEKIMIGDNIVVIVLEVNADQVRIGVSAPKDIPVHREEVATRIAREKAAAAAVKPR